MVAVMVVVVVVERIKQRQCGCCDCPNYLESLLGCDFFQALLSLSFSF